MGLILLIIFFIALIPALVLKLILKPDNRNNWLWVIGTTIIIGGFSWFSLLGIDSPGSSAGGFNQVVFYVILFALAPSIGIIIAKLISLSDE